MRRAWLGCADLTALKVLRSKMEQVKKTRVARLVHTRFTSGAPSLLFSCCIFRTFWRTSNVYEKCQMCLAQILTHPSHLTIPNVWCGADKAPLEGSATTTTLSVLEPEGDGDRHCAVTPAAHSPNLPANQGQLSVSVTGEKQIGHHHVNRTPEVAIDITMLASGSVADAGPAGRGGLPTTIQGKPVGKGKLSELSEVRPSSTVPGLFR